MRYITLLWSLFSLFERSKARDDIKANELIEIIRSGVQPNRWNGSAEREKLSAQRMVWKMRKAGLRNNQLNNYDTLKLERDNGTEENKASLARQRELESEIKSLQEQLKIDKRRTDLKERISGLRSDATDEQTLRREWVIRRAAIDMELETLRKGPLAGTRINGRRPGARPSGQEASTGSSSATNGSAGVDEVQGMLC